jgi:hypothetical protein
MDSIDFGCHQSFFEQIAKARKNGSSIAKKQKQHKTRLTEVKKKQ